MQERFSSCDSSMKVILVERGWRVEQQTTTPGSAISSSTRTTIVQILAWSPLLLLTVFSSLHCELRKWGPETLCYLQLSPTVVSCFVGINQCHFQSFRQLFRLHGCWLLGQDERNLGITKALKLAPHNHCYWLLSSQNANGLMKVWYLGQNYMRSPISWGSLLDCRFTLKFYKTKIILCKVLF